MYRWQKILTPAPILVIFRKQNSNGKWKLFFNQWSLH